MALLCLRSSTRRTARSGLSAVLLGLGLVFAPACQPQDSVGLYVGEVLIPAAEIDGAVQDLRRAFRAFGQDTLRWSLLSQGLGPGTLLHQDLPEESQAAKEEAHLWAARVAAGEDFLDLIDELDTWTGRTSKPPFPLPPTPFALGARVAAKVATMEAGDWAGPLKTRDGWEIIRLQERFDQNRSRSSVVVLRLVFHVGDSVDHAKVAEDWARLPLSGDQDYLDALPPLFRANRVVSRP
ncbi:MAG: peptidyl-prolyl cis-trans isomerase [Planctomycetota bacterium]|nr:MAG: peptidyl-prolyl cis-trans isomerase [Planctomycetota bacterium]